MQARLKSSKKWTLFPAEYIAQIERVFRENFAAQIGSAELLVEGRIYPEEILLRVGLKEKGRLKQSNFEVSMQYDPKKKDAVERIHNCIDAAASMMAEYFETDDDDDFPRTWKEYPFQGKALFLQYTTENSELEAEADRLLGESDDSLVHDAEENEDALARAEVDKDLSDDPEEGVPLEEDEDDNDDPSPRMFSGKGKKKGDMH